MKQNSSKRRRPKGCLIAFLVFLVLIAVVWFIGIPFANKKPIDVGGDRTKQTAVERR